MADNRYYIINDNDPNKAEILSFTVGLATTQRYSLDGLQLVIKLFKTDHDQHNELNQYTEYSHADILPVMAAPEWQAPMI